MGIFIALTIFAIALIVLIYAKHKNNVDSKLPFLPEKLKDFTREQVEEAEIFAEMHFNNAYLALRVPGYQRVYVSCFNIRTLRMEFSPLVPSIGLKIGDTSMTEEKFLQRMKECEETLVRFKDEHRII